MKPIVLKGKRIRLRSVRMSDAKVFLPYINDLDIVKYLGNIRPPVSLIAEKTWLNGVMKKYRNGDDFTFAVEHKTLKRVIGSCGLHVNKENNRASFGLWIAKEFWQQDYGKEMAKLVMNFGFNKLKLNRIEYTLDVRNKGSKALIESIGGKLEGKRRQYTKKGRKYYDDLLYSILRNEWKNRP